MANLKPKSPVCIACRKAHSGECVRQWLRGRPVCAACHFTGEIGESPSLGNVHVCANCLREMEAGRGIRLDERMLPVRQAL